MGRGDEFGTLEAGKLADVLVVDGDVLADIALLEDRKTSSPSCKAASSKRAAWRVDAPTLAVSARVPGVFRLQWPGCVFRLVASRRIASPRRACFCRE